MGDDFNRIAEIPKELRDLSQWVAWKYKVRDGKRTKVPYRVANPRVTAEPDNPETWTTFPKALNAYANRDKNGIDGIGFVFSAKDPFCGVDLDNSIEDGQVLEWARPILERLMPTYAEISPSGTGVKLWVRAELPGKGTRKGDYLGIKGVAVEIYDRTRFFTTTGRILDHQHRSIEDRSEYVLELYAAAKEKPKKERAAKPEGAADALPEDDELLARARRSKNGPKFSALFDGSIEGHASHSEADLALCSHLAFWCGGDIDRIDRLFRRSQLCTEKWTEREDYRAATIEKACDRSAFYDPKYRTKKAAGTRKATGTDGPTVAAGAQPDEDGPRLHEPPGDAFGQVELPKFSNYHWEEYRDEEGRKKVKPEPHDLREIEADLEALGRGWPKRIKESLFVESPSLEPVFLGTSTRLFSWIDRRARVDWTKGSRFITQERFYETLRMSAEQFEAIEVMPHTPPMRGIYYMHQALPEPTGKLDELIDRFSPYSEVDRSLIKAMIVTPSWGGLPGSRPIFVVTGPDRDAGQGRGVGKTKIVDLIASRLYGGSIAVSANEDMAGVKTRLFSVEGNCKRILRLDNVKSHQFSWADMEDLVTAETISGKALYVGEGSRPNTFTWMVTVNGPSLSKDLSQRAVVVKLKRPTYAAGWEVETAAFMERHRWEILADAAQFLAQPPAALESRVRWSTWEAAVLSKLDRAEECQREIIVRQQNIDADNETRLLVYNFLREQFQKAGHDPDTAYLKIASKSMADLLSFITGKKYETNQASQVVGGLTISELHRVKERDFRGWIWFGGLSKESDPTKFEPDLAPYQPYRRYV